VSLLLIDLIKRKSEISTGRALVQQLENAVQELVPNIFGRGCEHESFKCSVEVLSALLHHESTKVRGSAEDEVVIEEDTPILYEVMAQYMQQLALELLKDPEPQPTSFKELRIPLGPTRLRMLEFLLSTIRCCNPKINLQICKLQIFKIVNEMLLKFEWNSIFQVVFEQIIRAVLEGNEEGLKESLLGDC